MPLQRTYAQFFDESNESDNVAYEHDVEEELSGDDRLAVKQEDEEGFSVPDGEDPGVDSDAAVAADSDVDAYADADDGASVDAEDREEESQEEEEEEEEFQDAQERAYVDELFGDNDDDEEEEAWYDSEEGEESGSFLFSDDLSTCSGMSLDMEEYGGIDESAVVEEMQAGGNSGCGWYPRMEEDIVMEDVEMVDADEEEDVVMEEASLEEDVEMEEVADWMDIDEYW